MCAFFVLLHLNTRPLSHSFYILLKYFFFVQVFHSLLKAHAVEARSVVRQALEILTPSMPGRMEDGKSFTILKKKWTKKQHNITFTFVHLYVNMLYNAVRSNSVWIHNTQKDCNQEKQSYVKQNAPTYNAFLTLLMYNLICEPHFVKAAATSVVHGGLSVVIFFTVIFNFLLVHLFISSWPGAPKQSARNAYYHKAEIV